MMMMMTDNELEEGEAYAGNYDPDVALSYIDTKLHNCLGHFYKDFEGEVSAENLGAKFGGYGSFLPTHQRSPSRLLQPRAQAPHTSNNASRTPNELLGEKLRTGVQGSDSKAFSLSVGSNATAPAGNHSKVSAGILPNVPAPLVANTSNRGDTSGNSAKGNRDVSPLKRNSFPKNTTSDQLKVKLKIKPPSEPLQCNKNSALYSELGLKASPSPSPEFSPNGSQSCFPENDSTPAPSPMTIIQHMSSREIPGASLLTPLHECFLNFPERYEKIMVKQKKKAKTDNLQFTAPVKNEFETLKESQSQNEKLGLPNQTKRNHLEGRRESGLVSVKNMPNSLKISGVSSDVVGEAVKSSSKEKIAMNDYSNDDTFETNRNTVMKNPRKFKISNQGQEMKDGNSDKIPKSEPRMTPENSKDLKFNDPSKELVSSKEKPVQKNLNMDSSRDRTAASEGIPVPTKQNGRDVGNKKHRDTQPKFSSSKDKPKNLVSESCKDSRSDRYLKDASVGEAVFDSLKGQKEPRNVSRERDYVKGGHELNGGKKDLFDAYQKDIRRDIKYITEKSSSRVLENDRDRKQSLSKSSSFKKMDRSSTEANVVAPTTHPVSGGMSSIEGTVAPHGHFLINENWVQCDNCNTWRLLPYGREAPNSSSKWLCSMLDWLPNMNSCKFTEEQTTNALYAKYASEFSIQGQLEGTNKDYLQSSTFLPSNAGLSNAKKVDSHHVLTNGFGPTNYPSTLKKDKQNSVKSKSLNDVVQQPSEKFQAWDAGHGNMPTTKTKRKNENETDAQKSVKKMKSDELACNVGRNDSVTVKPAVSKVKRYIENSSPANGIKNMPKGTKEYTSMDTDSRGTYSSFDTERISKKDSSGKKRKLKDSKESQSVQDLDKGYNKECWLPLKEEDETGNEYLNAKRPKISKSEGKESSTSKASGKLERREHGTSLVNPSSRISLNCGAEDRSHGVTAKSRGSNVARIITRELAAAASSSSKMSCSFKTAANIHEQRGSPIESVSSSPLRYYKAEKQSPGRQNCFGLEDAMDGMFNNLASPRRGSDGGDDTQSDHSVPPRRVGKFIIQSGLCESAKGNNASLPNMAIADESQAKVVKGLADANIKLVKSRRKAENASVDTGKKSLSMNGLNASNEPYKYSVDKNERAPTQGEQKGNGSHNPLGKVTRETGVTDQERERKSTSVQEGRKGKTQDSFCDSHEGFLTDCKDSGNRWHEGLFEDEKHANKSDKDRNAMLDRNMENETISTKVLDGGKGNKSKFHSEINIDNQISDSQNKLTKDPSIRHSKSSGGQLKDGKSTSQHNLKQVTLLVKEKTSAQALGSDCASLATALNKGKSQAVLEGRTDSKANNVGPVASAKKGSRDVTAVEACSAELQAAKSNPHASSMKGVVKGAPKKDLEVAAASPARREHGQTSGTAVFNEAKALKHSADRQKSIGSDEFETTMLYLEAALNFLHAASLFESSSSDNLKHGDTTHSMKVYSDTAQLCKFCASQFERLKENAAAALAYKCMGVAHMRVVFSKTSGLSRDFLELQASFQSAPIGESPSSSASDVDNLNNHALVDKSSVNPSKLEETSQISSNFTIPARQLPHFRRLLQYTNDVSASMEAFKKSENAYGMAVKQSHANNRAKDILLGVKTVIDFSFQDIDGFLRLVRIAMEALTH